MHDDYMASAPIYRYVHSVPDLFMNQYDTIEGRIEKTYRNLMKIMKVVL